ncbi:hypothetical protein L1887_22684 [Cichorium endivia]|nr:hypothetical protein L1887_22684 [Cichorium endivia]
MDPNPKNFPILSYVMKRPNMLEGDIEAATPHSSTFMTPHTTFNPPPYFELTERMPNLTDPQLLASMRSARLRSLKGVRVVKGLTEDKIDDRRRRGASEVVVEEGPGGWSCKGKQQWRRWRQWRRLIRCLRVERMPTVIRGSEGFVNGQVQVE